LIFYEGKPLGQRGLRWLKIHLANVYGLDKMKLDEREQFAENNLEDVFDSADRPLEVTCRRESKLTFRARDGG
jgi:DNA-directed RNA polymerase, mitochondrial